MSRRPAPRVLLLAATIAAGAGGCVYLPTINAEPDAAIEKVSITPIEVDGDPVVLSASGSTDPDGSDNLKAQWRAVWCNDAAATDCPPANEIDLADGSIEQTFSFVPENRQPVRVTLTVTDHRGATDTDELVVEVVNRPADLSLQRQGYEWNGAYPLGTYIDVLADASDPDGDALDLIWELFTPTGSTAPGWAPCPAVDDCYRLTPDAAGLYNVQVTADDGSGSVDETAPVLAAADAPPCLSPTRAPGGTYPVDRDGGPWSVGASSVIDDLDAWPMELEPGDTGWFEFLGASDFAWQVASPDTAGELVAVEGLDAASYLLDPSVFAPGDRITLRVEVADRVARTLPCADDQPACSIGGDTCLQRVSWEVEIR